MTEPTSGPLPIPPVPPVPPVPGSSPPAPAVAVSSAAPRPRAGSGVRTLTWVTLGLGIVGLFGLLPSLVTMSLVSSGVGDGYNSAQVSARLQLIGVVVVLALAILALVLTLRQHAPVALPIVVVVIAAVNALAVSNFMLPLAFLGT